MKAPDFTLQDQNGQTHSLDEFAGKWLVLYFYLKDETTGCTTQACSFRDAREVIANLGDVEVVGVSLDSVESHKTFADEHGLDFTLLSDPDHQVIEAYGAWKPDETKGPGYIPTQRNTYIIDPQGEIVKTYEGVDPNTNAAEILKDLQEFKSQATATP
jgi:thioredoxin-dependent peroxiredoxin